MLHEGRFEISSNAGSDMERWLLAETELLMRGIKNAEIERSTKAALRAERHLQGNIQMKRIWLSESRVGLNL